MDNKAISSDLIRGHIDTIILYTLVDGDKHAQQISDVILERSDNAYQINQATLYSSLKRLESQKYVSAYWHNAELGRRRYFKLTLKGSQTITDNMSNWSYSRNIIDKLMNIEPEKTIHTVYVPVKETEKTEVVAEPINKPNIILAEQPPKPYVEPEKTVEIEQKTVVEQKSIEPEKNFRIVLSDLIKQTEKSKPEITELSPIEKDENLKIEDVIPKFNDSINISTPVNSGNKIDFADVVLKGEKEGYKVSVSSKEKSVKFGSVYVNKLKLYSAMAVLILGLLEFFIISLTCRGFIKFNLLTTILPILFLISYPVIISIIYFKNPLKTSGKVQKDSILNCAIVIFNLILFTVVVNLLAETNFENKVNLILYIVTPLLICINAIIYYVIRYNFSKSKFFRNEKK